jgi:hypothetical protein
MVLHGTDPIALPVGLLQDWLRRLRETMFYQNRGQVALKTISHEVGLDRCGNAAVKGEQER